MPSSALLFCRKKPVLTISALQIGRLGAGEGLGVG